ncbi:hypothetical protein [Rhodanobacter sp. B05]|uniref:hypothetical protein n=1 Tax=Rhodanobacter sp. B05 TaxID=1945859 RepID=UPI001115837B|nr:hypothetical protein [Rhodanobacter sp. B05]
MEILLELISSIPSFFVGLLIGCVSLYVTAYLKEKGKSRALREDVKSLEEEKQKIILMHQKEIEDIKKDHQLDIEKRKYRYESKKSQYYQFMEEIDEFNGCLARILYVEFSNMMLEFYGFKHGVSGLSGDELTVKFNKMAQFEISNLESQESKLYSRLNSFKLSSTDEIAFLLKEVMLEIQKSKKNLVDILKYIQRPEFQVSRDVPEEILRISDSCSSNLANAKEKLLTALKNDLDEI